MVHPPLLRYLGRRRVGVEKTRIYHHGRLYVVANSELTIKHIRKNTDIVEGRDSAVQKIMLLSENVKMLYNENDKLRRELLKATHSPMEHYLNVEKIRNGGARGDQK